MHSKEVARLDKSPDIWEAAEKGIKSWDSVYEIQELLAGKIRGRTHAEEITLFNNNTGAGTQFAALGSVVLKKAREMGLGREAPDGVVSGGCVAVRIRDVPSPGPFGEF